VTGPSDADRRTGAADRRTANADRRRSDPDSRPADAERRTAATDRRTAAAGRRTADARLSVPRRSRADGDPRESLQLRSELEDVGVRMNLPLKYWRDVPATRPSAGNTAVWTRTRLLRHAPALIGVAALLLIVANEGARRPKAETTLPPELQGEWRTDAARYANRRLEITTSSLAFQVGDSAAAITRHRIVRVQRSAAPEGTLFRVEYLEEGDLLEFSFVWRGSPTPEIRFANQKGLVWTRTGPAEPAPAPGRPVQ
jgi:hypothetical protein